MSIIALQTQLALIKAKRDYFYRFGFTKTYLQAGTLQNVVHDTISWLEKGNQPAETLVQINTNLKIFSDEINAQSGWVRLFYKILSFVVSVISLGSANWLMGRKWLFSPEEDLFLLVADVQNELNSISASEKSELKPEIDVTSDPQLDSDGTIVPHATAENVGSRPNLLGASASMGAPDESINYSTAAVVTTLNESPDNRGWDLDATIAPPTTGDNVGPRPNLLAPGVMGASEESTSYSTAAVVTTLSESPDNLGWDLDATIAPPTTGDNVGPRPNLLAPGVMGASEESTSYLIAPKVASPAELLDNRRLGLGPTTAPPHTENHIEPRSNPLDAIAGEVQSTNPLTLIASRIYQYNPYALQVNQLINTLDTNAENINQFSKHTLSFVQTFFNAGWADDQFTITKTRLHSAETRQFIHVGVTLHNLSHINLLGLLKLKNDTNFLKLIRDLNFLNLDKSHILMGYGSLSFIHRGYDLAFKASALYTSYNFVQNSFELYKNKSILAQPLTIISQLTAKLFEPAAPWSKASFGKRLDAHYLLYNVMIGTDSEPSLFELRIQNFLYNLTIQSAAQSGPVLAKFTAGAYLPIHMLSNLWQGIANDYTWYPDFAGSLIGLVPQGIIAGLNSQLPAVLTGMNPVVLGYLFNKVIWDHLIRPLFINLPFTSMTMAAARIYAEQTINSPDFILKLRPILIKTLQNLLNPDELLQFSDFQPPKRLRDASPFRKMGIYTSLAEMGLFIYNLSELRSPRTLKANLDSNPVYLDYNPRDNLIKFLTHTPLNIPEEDEYWSLTSEGIVNKITDSLESTLKRPGFTNSTKEKRQKSYLEYLTIPLMQVAITLPKLYINKEKQLLKAIDDATTLSLLPSLNEVRQTLIMLETGHGYAFFTPKLAALRSEQLKTKYKTKLHLLKENIANAKTEITQLAQVYERLVFQIEQTSKKLRVSNDIVQQVTDFRGAVLILLDKYAKDQDASESTQLLTTLPNQLDSQINEKNTAYLNELRFTIFLAFITNRCAEKSDIDQLLQINQQQNDTHCFDSISSDLQTLKTHRQSTEFKSYMDVLGPVTLEIMRLERLFSNWQHQNLSYNEFIELVKKYTQVEKTFLELISPFDGDFMAFIEHKLQNTLDYIEEQQKSIQGNLTFINQQFMPLEKMFVDLRDRNVVSLPDAKKLSTYQTLMQSSLDIEQLPVFLDYQELQRETYNIALYQQLMLDKLDFIIAARTQELSTRNVDTKILNNAIERLFSEVYEALPNFLNTMEYEKFQFSCEIKLQKFTNKIHKNFDATNEIKKALTELEAYITKVETLVSLMSKPWLGAPQPLLVVEETDAVINKAIEILKPYLAYHSVECHRVLDSIGLTVAGAILPVNELIKSSVNKLVKEKVFALINADIDLVNRQYSAAKDSLSTNLIDVNIQVLLAKYACCSGYFAKPEELETFIRTQATALLAPLLAVKVEWFTKQVTDKLTVLRDKLTPAPASRRMFHFFSANPVAISDVEYTGQVDLIRQQINGFEPSCEREKLLALLTKIAPVTSVEPS